MTVWMSDDSRHIPLKIKVKIKFGHIVAHLTKYSNSAPLITRPPIIKEP
ncbi:MAG: DUF3108 domain-containing protein [Mariprofundus sp.]|nr:DUF3108 domain-containing protein [Mariprofundus sp.]